MISTNNKIRNETPCSFNRFAGWLETSLFYIPFVQHAHKPSISRCRDWSAGSRPGFWQILKRVDNVMPAAWTCWKPGHKPGLQRLEFYNNKITSAQPQLLLLVLLWLIYLLHLHELLHLRHLMQTFEISINYCQTQEHSTYLQHRRIVTFLIIAPYKYSYLLTYLLTVCLQKKNQLFLAQYHQTTAKHYNFWQNDQANNCKSHYDYGMVLWYQIIFLHIFITFPIMIMEWPHLYNAHTWF